MDDCVFCKIVKGEINCHKIYEDDLVLVFLDANPVTKGHTLVIPKKHYKDIFDIDSKTLYHMIDVSRDISKLLIDKLDCEGVTITQNNGLGQEVKHIHIHLMPRYSIDNPDMRLNKLDLDLKQVASCILN